MMNRRQRETATLIRYAMKKENRLNKKDLARRMSRHGGMTIEMAETCLSSLVEVFRETMANDGEIVLKNMGSFSICEMKERLMYNPATGEHIVMDARRRVKFTPSITLRVNGEDGADGMEEK